jgi:hypothetical protein
MKSLRLALAFTSLLAAAGCTGLASEPTANDDSAIVHVNHTDVERQTIGNCWIYAHASWIESMNKTATGKSFDSSQSYWTYWHWFDQIAGGFTSTVETGGRWTTANDIIRKYGLMAEKDFIALDTQSEGSNTQKFALDAINESLKSGVLKNPAARRDRKRVRAELDRVWGLSAAQSAMLDKAFGADVSKTFASSASNAGTTIITADEFDVAYATGPGKPMKNAKLTQAMNEWHEEFYSHDAKREFLLKVQKALHAEQPVVIVWFVDFNAMENGQNALRGSFNIDTLNKNGPGHQGGHMTVLEDYQARLSDGTVLKAGTTLDPNNPADKKLLDHALQPDTEVEFLRVKNSWGSARPDRAFAPGMPGYHDLYINYLDADVKHCAEKNGETDTSDCNFSAKPLESVVLPPGF